MQPGFYLLDGRIEISTSPEPLALLRDWAAVQVTLGSVVVAGHFYQPHTWRFLPAHEESSVFETSERSGR
jgi:hypothetical protein